MEKKRILVVDDRDDNRAAAEEQLQGHDLTVIASFSDAMQAIYYRKYEVVMSDLYLHNEPVWPPPDHYVGMPIYRPMDDAPLADVPLGFSIVLYAALKGVSAVALVTQESHHATALSASLDWISNGVGAGFTTPPAANFRLNGARALFGYAPSHGSGGGKHWLKAWDFVLESLFKE